MLTLGSFQSELGTLGNTFLSVDLPTAFSIKAETLTGTINPAVTSLKIASAATSLSISPAALPHLIEA